MNILVYGLGIIGASICASLKRAGHTVIGRNRSRVPLEYAHEHNMIDGIAEGYEGADVVFLALPPKVAMRELAEGNFPAGCIVSDICGVKEPLEKTFLKERRGYRYVGIHPMAGKATTGIKSASATLFDNANLVLTEYEGMDENAREIILGLARDMGFSHYVCCSAREHDGMIALTSQLAHVVSSAYIKSDKVPSVRGFTGGSFQDMTRIAPMDPVWAELFLLNKEALSGEISRLQARLADYKEALESGDEDRLLRLIDDGKRHFKEISGSPKKFL